MSLGTGRPIILRDESCVRLSRVLLSHPMASPTDVRLISLVDLVAQKSQHTFYTVSHVTHLTRLESRTAQIYETLAPFNGPLNHSSLAVIRRANASLDNWYKECDDLHSTSFLSFFELFQGSSNPLGVRQDYGR